jgi:bacteriophage exclusion system BrxC/D-like protein
VTLESGDRVRHAKWGGGVVVKRLAHKAARVAFDDVPKLPRTIKLGDLQPEAAGDLNSHREPEAPRPVPIAPAATTHVREPNRSAFGDLEGTKDADPTVSPTATTATNSSPARRATTSVARTTEGTAIHASTYASAAQRAKSSAVAEDHDLTAVDAWQSLEALRLGVVPIAGVQRYTVGRERELSRVAGVLQQTRGCRVLWGDYGTGKTHLLESAERLALDEGFAVARLTLDPRENALSNPLRVYREIVHRARIGNGLRPAIDWLFETLKQNGDPTYIWSNGSNASRFYSPYLLALREDDEESSAILRDYVMGQAVDSRSVREAAEAVGWTGPAPLVMSDFRTYGRMYIHLIGQLSCWLAAAGARGLVVLFDEVERVDALRYEDRHYALEVLQHYAAVTMHPRDLAFDPERLYKGGHEVHRSLTLRVDAAQPLITVFALTPLEEIQEQFEQVTASNSYDIELGPLDERLLPELVDRIATIYALAHPSYTITDSLRASIARELLDAFDEGHESFRSAVRGAVLLLDADRLDWPARMSG